MMNQYFYIKNVVKPNGVNTVFSSEKPSNLRATWQKPSQMGAPNLFILARVNQNTGWQAR